MPRFDYPVPLPPLSLHGALALGAAIVHAAEPLEDRPAFLTVPLLRLDESVRELRGAIQYRGQLRLAHPSRQQNARADELCNQVLDGERMSAPEHEPWMRARTLQAEAVELLRKAEAKPTAEAAWAELSALLARHGVKLEK